MDNKIHLPVRSAKVNPQGVIKITPEAYEALVEVTGETGMSVRGGGQHDHRASR